MAPRRILGLALALASCGACSSGASGPGAATRGPGTFELPNGGVGLETLARYRASLTITSAGVPTTLRREVIRAPAAELASLETVDQNGQAVHLSYAVVGDARYLVSGAAGRCEAIADARLVGDAPGRLPDPSSALPAVRGAEAVGPEPVGGVPAIHYRFDQRAVSVAGGGTASGDAWIAQPGGWVVRYTLAVQAPDGARTWQYQVTDPGATAAVPLPEGCRPLLADVPVLPDAQGLVRRPSALHYASATALPAATSFYDAQMQAAGWAAERAFAPRADRTTLLFRKGAGLALVTLRAAPTGVRVRVALARPGAPG